ncbi:putative cytokinetic ring protein SteA [Paenibacillus xerothermodurans]|uniref:Thiamine pyrophosphokinase n=1 Tax=Paenibacillus xerothermodurans TaxID=1977292 RepID=A0A2W1P2S4_PAEXE|nr:putative cytokinetic ring protein SteA [Paenibacillus xerothermodurans]PZE22032.1 thiamine pyrophosphokinase [Paenibacillus xerothermodurans]
MAVRRSVVQAEIARGVAYTDTVTKRLLRQIVPESIAVIRHDDLDDLAADGLLQARVKAVINAGCTMSGTIPSEGPRRLLEQGVPIVEIAPSYFPLLQNGMEVCLMKDSILAGGAIIPSSFFTRERWHTQYEQAKNAHNEQLKQFIDNTLTFAALEKELVLEPLRCPHLRTVLKGRQALIVIRGKRHHEDLAALGSYISRTRPVLIGVDGGADALLEHGLTPQIIIGDMDSVSDRALRCGAELVVHAYRSGRAPGLTRIMELGLSAVVVSCCGTSEDLALLLAHDLHCERIVTVGLHTNMYDFLEKGRRGMGSSLLVRMKVGHKLIDSRGAADIISLPESIVRPQAAANVFTRWFPFMFRKLFSQVRN